jgi:hypothetical protein
MYDLIQTALTAATEVIAIAGITGIAAHAIFTAHQCWMSTYCPAVKTFKPEMEQVEAIAPAPQPEQVETVVEEVPEVDAAPQPERVETVVVETVEADAAAPEIDLNSLDSTVLRRLCSQHGIVWRDVRGKNRHASKAMMIFQLNQVAVA